MAPRWTAAEDDVLREQYAAGASLRAIAATIGRSENAVGERRRALAIPARRAARPWTADEDALLRGAAAANVPSSALAARLGRPVEHVRRRRRELVGTRGRGRPYAASEDAAIRAAWSTGADVGALARTLGRSAGSVRLRATSLGLHRPSPRHRWTAAEDAAVRDGYGLGLTCDAIAAQLAGRTATAVAARAAKLGLATYARAWSHLDDRRLRRLVADGVTVERAALALSRSPEALRARARKLGIAPPRRSRHARAGRPWSAADDELLALHRERNPAALAELLQRSPEAITQRLRKLGLREGRHRSPHRVAPRRGGATPGELAAIARELRDGGPARRLAVVARLEVDPELVAAFARRRSA